MVAGIAMLGVVTGSIASWFVDRFGGIERQLEETSSESQRLDNDSEALRREIGILREEIASLRHELTASKTEARGHD